MDMPSTPDENTEEERYRLPGREFYFLLTGTLFIAVGLGLFITTGYMCVTFLKASMVSPLIQFAPETGGGPASVTGPEQNREMFNFAARSLSFLVPPLLCLVAAIICTSAGFLLLRSAGAVTKQVISPQDYPVLAPAIAKGDEQAITQWIRLNSLSGVTGMFTKIGFTGLPLATLFLTVVLAVLGLEKTEFFDLAKLTLGAFLGSFVQRQNQSGKNNTAE
jgi:hypothetical protein